MELGLFEMHQTNVYPYEIYYSFHLSILISVTSFIGTLNSIKYYT
jgi:hypothetical protein